MAKKLIERSILAEFEQMIFQEKLKGSGANIEALEEFYKKNIYDSSTENNKYTKQELYKLIKATSNPEEREEYYQIYKTL